MKTKTRKVIGNILVWGGISIVALTSLLTLWRPDLTIFGLVTDSARWNLGAIISLLIGGLWGMHK